MITVMNRVTCWLLLILSALTSLPATAADTRILIIRDDTMVARQAAELLGREFARLGWTAVETSAGQERPNGGREGEHAVVALGARALTVAMKSAGGRPLVGALVSRPALEELLPASAERWSVIVLDQPAERWATLIQAAFPARQQVGVLVGPAAAKSMRALERRLQDKRHLLTSEIVSSPTEVVPALEKLLPRINLLLALPDPVAHNRNTVQPLLLTTYRAGIPVIGYSESYLQAGSTLALYSTVPNFTAQIIESLQQFFEGRPPAAIQVPRYYTVGINNAVARSLGLLLPSERELQDRLRSSDQ